MNAVALKLQAAVRSRLNLLINKWHHWRLLRREAARLREQRWKEEADQVYFQTLDSIRRADHWPTMKLLLKSGDWVTKRYRKELLQQLDYEVFEQLSWDDVERFSGRMQRVMLLIYRLWDDPDARRIFQLLCHDYGEYNMQQDLRNIGTMWNDFFPSDWFSKTND